MSDAPTVTSPPNADTRTEDRTRAQRLVAAWLAGTATPPEDDLRIEPLRGDAGSELCFCAGTFCWPPVPPTGGQQHARNDTE
ncbi:hypothetical protein RB614_06400 [Phytohabitans sp. ZYX-F-186]|uniref:Uncharacterized protein n=1 Tax=Phytohabitans maris TaxID=3071409 RepID=A0ABU0ZAS1_9ACTN|nr:hypothetical protein [Phytohabitans sp. ZYX-F-186]MDQ7904152.1 hypothetical protein [Phytohabitans sp. ZYX-F-186]